MSTALFFRLLKDQDKRDALVEECDAARTATPSGRQFEVNPDSFSCVKTSPFGYWISEDVRKMFSDLPTLDSCHRKVRSTNPLNDDFRYARLWWEVGTGLGSIWIPWAKGGSFSPFYYDIDTVIHWDPSRQTYRGFLGTANRPLSRPASVQHFFEPGLTWPRRTNGLSFRALPRNAIFSDKGPGIFVEGSTDSDLTILAAILNSAAFRILVEAQLARTELAQSFEVGLIQNTPVPEPEPIQVSELAQEALQLQQSRRTSAETSHVFILPGTLRAEGRGLSERIHTDLDQRKASSERFATVLDAIDEIVFDAYGFNRTDRKPALSPPKKETGSDLDILSASSNSDRPDPAMGARDLLSWLVGAALGRWDVRVATGQRKVGRLGNPFDELPRCSPGMLQTIDGLRLRRAPDGYPIQTDEDGILVDGRGIQDDIIARVREVLVLLFEDADAVEREACEILGVKRLRDYFASTGSKGFWVDHVKRYSKSRRKAPIYWLIESPAGTTRFWLYLHRLDRDTLPKLLGQRYLGGMIEQTTHDIDDLRRRSEAPSKKDEKQLASLGDRLSDVEELATRIRRVLERTNDRGEIVGYDPDLDDGVVLCAAPLHDLIPWPHKKKYKSRSMSELEVYWHELEEGKYDWAHVAMHHWPARVEGVCKRDKSIAIAHGRECLENGRST